MTIKTHKYPRMPFDCRLSPILRIKRIDLRIYVSSSGVGNPISRPCSAAVHFLYNNPCLYRVTCAPWSHLAYETRVRWALETVEHKQNLLPTSFSIAITTIDRLEWSSNRSLPMLLSRSPCVTPTVNVFMSLLDATTKIQIVRSIVMIAVQKVPA